MLRGEPIYNNIVDQIRIAPKFQQVSGFSLNGNVLYIYKVWVSIWELQDEITCSYHDYQLSGHTGFRNNKKADPKIIQLASYVKRCWKLY